MTTERRRPKRVGRLLQEALGPILLRELGGVTSNIVTVTSVAVPADLRTARVYVSVFGPDDPDIVLRHLEHRAGIIRKSLASAVQLKYNPLLVFALDPSLAVSDRIEQLLQRTRRHDRDAD